MIYRLSNNFIVKVEIIDIPGYEKFRNLYEDYYRKANSIILVYDITNQYSFDSCKTFFSLKIKEKRRENVKVILLGNKKDLEDKRKISYEEAKNFADLNNYKFMEISCLENQNIFDLFEELIISYVKINENTNINKVKKKVAEIKNENNNSCNII